MQDKERKLQNMKKKYDIKATTKDGTIYYMQVTASTMESALNEFYKTVYTVLGVEVLAVVELADIEIRVII